MTFTKQTKLTSILFALTLLVSPPSIAIESTQILNYTGSETRSNTFVLCIPPIVCDKE
jgi:hypothetical protein